MGRLGPTELLLILLVVLLLFGAKRLPDLSRSLGRSLRILKSETKALQDDDSGAPSADATRGTATPRGTGEPEPGSREVEPDPSPVAASESRETR